MEDDYGLESYHVTSWTSNKFSQGTWSIPRVGFDPNMKKPLTLPLSDNFMFAGEACTIEYSTTVHGAALTGVKAANFMSEDMKDDDTVVIIGCGSAGTFAASEMKRLKPNSKIIIIEGRDRIGGRVHSINLSPNGGTTEDKTPELGATILEDNKDGSVRVDLGATWLHCCNEEIMGRETNWLVHEAKELGLKLIASDFTKPMGAASDTIPTGDVHSLEGELYCELAKHLRRIHRKRYGSRSESIDVTKTPPMLDSVFNNSKSHNTINSSSNSSNAHDISANDEIDSGEETDEDSDNVLPVDKDIDTSMAEALETYLRNLDPIKRRIAALALKGVIHIDNGTNFSDMSARWTLEQPGVGDGDNYIVGGLMQLLLNRLEKCGAVLQRGLERKEAHTGNVHVWLDTTATHIDWSSSTSDKNGNKSVIITTSAGVIHASRCICTCPFEVINKGILSFTPSLPSRVIRCIKHLMYAKVEKVVLRFKERWWVHKSNVLSNSPKNIIHWYGDNCYWGKKTNKTPDEFSSSNTNDNNDNNDISSKNDFGDGVNPDTLPHTGWIEWLDMSDSLGIPVIMGFIAGEASIKKFHQGTDKEIANRAVKELAAWAETRRLMDSRKPRKKEL